MIFANKKVNLKENSAQQNAQIIANVIELEHKQLIRLTADTVFLYPQIWKDKASALNWINCLHRYYVLKRQYKSNAALYFRSIVTDELIGTYLNKKAKLISDQ